MTAALLFAGFIAATSAGPTPPQPGKIVYEAAGLANCAGFYMAPLPKFPLPPGPGPGPAPEPDLENRGPYRGEDMLKPIAPAVGPGSTGRTVKLTQDYLMMRDGPNRGFYRATASAMLTVSPLGEVIRAEVRSPNDSLLAAMSAAQMAFWRYQPRPNSRKCARFKVDIEIQLN